MWGAVLLRKEGITYFPPCLGFREKKKIIPQTFSSVRSTKAASDLPLTSGSTAAPQTLQASFPSGSLSSLSLFFPGCEIVIMKLRRANGFLIACVTADGRAGTTGRKSASMWPLTRFWTSNHTAAQTRVTLSTEEATPTICLPWSCIMVKASAQGTTPHTATTQKEVRNRPRRPAVPSGSPLFNSLYCAPQVFGSTVMTLSWRFAAWRKCATLRPIFFSIPRGLPRNLSRCDSYWGLHLRRRCLWSFPWCHYERVYQTIW